MAIIFADGFDTYYRLNDVGTRWSSNVTFDHGAAAAYSELMTGRRAGGKAMSPSIVGSNSSTASGASLYTTITASTECALALAIKPDYNGAGTGNAFNGYHPIVTFASASTMLLRVVRHAQTGAVAAYLGGSGTLFHDANFTGATALTNSLNGLATGTAGLTTGDWNHVQVVYKVADSGGTISVLLNGVEIWAFSGDTKPGTATTFDTIALYGGNPNNANGSANHAGGGVYTAYDDIVVATGTTAIGDAGVVALKANGNGNSTDWTATGTALGESAVAGATVTFGTSGSGNAIYLTDGLCGQRAPLGFSYPALNTSQTNWDNNVWIRVDFGTAKEIGGWRWTQVPTSSSHIVSPSQKLQGSSDGTTWTDLDSLTQASSAAYDSGLRLITPASYRYFRFKYAATNTNNSSVSGGVAELELFPTLSSDEFQQFAEGPWDTSTYLQAGATNDTQLATYEDLGTTVGNVLAVQQRIIAGADSGSGTLVPIARVSGTNYSGTSISVSGAGTGKVAVWDTNPNTTIAWTRGQVNSAEFGAKMG